MNSTPTFTARGKDLTGRVFHDLSVIEHAGQDDQHRNIWRCLCVCGNERIVTASWLVRGQAKHCGCKTHKAKTVQPGDRYGKLLVIGKASKGCYWIVRCDCRLEYSVYQSNLLSGKATACRSCGHYRKGSGEAALNRLFRTYERQARVRNKEFDLTKDQFRFLISGDCYYCGAVPGQVICAGARGNGVLRYNGIDRVDNAKPYVLGNCVSCCGTCNHMKRDMTFDEFLAHIKRICSHSVEAVEVVLV